MHSLYQQAECRLYHVFLASWAYESDQVCPLFSLALVLTASKVLKGRRKYKLACLVAEPGDPGTLAYKNLNEKLRLWPS